MMSDPKKLRMRAEELKLCCADPLRPPVYRHLAFARFPHDDNRLSGLGPVEPPSIT